LNTRIDYRSGNLSMQFRLLPSSGRSDYALVGLVNPYPGGQLNDTQLELISRLIRESELRQMQEFDRRLMQTMWTLERRRQVDLMQMGQLLEQVSRETSDRLAQTRKMMEDLIVLTKSQGKFPK